MALELGPAWAYRGPPRWRIHRRAQPGRCDRVPHGDSMRGQCVTGPRQAAQPVWLEDASANPRSFDRRPIRHSPSTRTAAWSDGPNSGMVGRSRQRHVGMVSGVVTPSSCATFVIAAQPTPTYGRRCRPRPPSAWAAPSAQTGTSSRCFLTGLLPSQVGSLRTRRGRGAIVAASGRVAGPTGTVLGTKGQAAA